MSNCLLEWFDKCCFLPEDTPCIDLVVSNCFPLVAVRFLVGSDRLDPLLSGEVCVDVDAGRVAVTVSWLVLSQRLGFCLQLSSFFCPLLLPSSAN